ncbi:hypothetical protein NVP1016O_18 [Vibrio phage 1.016.O._10N.286.46.A11]|nr:hypothetical protein NVP1016O_18 [Vibrio phage 1.016.O._10N.286.46.A11]AUR85247.1 hypothetical protein NVP1071A_17 [Vibrio phage 1.071.A._10N.286.46.A12]
MSDALGLVVDDLHMYCNIHDWCLLYGNEWIKQRAQLSALFLLVNLGVIPLD